MSNVNATIGIRIDASQATAQLATLQKQMAGAQAGLIASNGRMATSTGTSAKAFSTQAKAMGASLAMSGQFTSGVHNISTSMGQMAGEFDKGHTSFRNYRANSRRWTKDHDRVNNLASERVKTLQSRYVALGKEVDGVQQVMQIRPTKMMKEFGGQAEFASQKAMLFRRNLQMGANSMVNWGKNTQWAGRQMMVGMGIPIGLAAAGAVKSFKDIE